ncbi:E3 ubiquitin-protein ligase complex SLX5-SLX8 subunit SLX8 [Nakaseomyces bracarensis]|uniref:E3 ubiquitin-protein ligase complex SLX5-SLX8 subunit SLX8 n=1 Tax=Nakaseomyces bracarensis TaxID=273131 RepID=A0ABR4P0A6_9SACH
MVRKRSRSDDEFDDEITESRDIFEDDLRPQVTTLDDDSNDDEEDILDVNKRRNTDLTPETINLEAEEQQVVEIPDEDEESKRREYKRVRDYKCPICFEPPEVSMMTPCGHVYCCECLFQMVNNSRTPRKAGVCALCRKSVNLKNIKMMILRKKKKSP